VSLKRSETYRATGFVLRRHDLGEADRIVTLYTREHGKRRAVAKGVRKQQSRLAGHIELFTKVDVYLAVGANLDVLTQAEALTTYPELAGDLERFAQASWAGETLDRLTPESEPDGYMFDLFGVVLAAIATADRPGLHLRQFELQALTRAGYRPHLEVCVECGEALAEVTNRFAPLAGGVVCPTCRTEGMSLPVTPRALKSLRWLLGADPGSAGRLNTDPELERELEELLKAYVTAVLGTESRSAQLLDRVRRPQADLSG
jgi:DNA repair protein RecO (recombination protein O)